MVNNREKEYQRSFSWILYLLQCLENISLYITYAAIAHFLSNADKGSLYILIGVPFANLLIRLLILCKSSAVIYNTAQLLESASSKRVLNSNAELRSLYRRIQQLLDFCMGREDLAANGTGIALLLSALFCIFGWRSLAVAVSALVAIPIARLLGTASVIALKKCNDLSAQRNECISNLIDRRDLFVGLHERNSVAKNNLDQIFRKERLWRGIDSAIKLSETYLGMLFKLIPFTIISILTVIGLHTGNDEARFILWMAMPILSSMLALPRQVQAMQGFRDASTALLLETRVSTPAKDDTVCFGDEQRVWQASLATNVLGQSIWHVRALEELGVLEELGAASHRRPLTKLLDPGRLSEGQMQRILLVRAVSFARREKKPLLIQKPFHALDDENRSRIVQFLNRVEREEKLQIKGMGVLNLSEAENTPQKSVTSQIYETVDNPAAFRSQRTWISLVMTAFLPIFILAGVTDALVTDRLNVLGRIPANVLVFAICGFSISIIAGLVIENAIRKRVCDEVSKAIFHSSAQSFMISKAIPVDFDTSVEGFSYYTHDIAWAVALFFVFAGTAIFEAGISGINLIFPVLAILAFLYKKIYRPLTNARENFLESARSFVSQLSTLRSFDLEFSAFMYRIRVLNHRAILGQREFRKWVKAKVMVMILKARLSIGLDFLFQIILAIGLAILAKYGHSTKISLGFFVAAVLAIQGEASRLFIAVSGLLTTMASFERVCDLRASQYLPKLNWQFFAKKIILDVSISKTTKVKYKNHVFHPGVTWVTGPSGSGKSTLLNDLFWSLWIKSRRSVYMRRDNSMQPIEVWLQKVRSIAENATCIILDEATTEFSWLDIGYAIQQLDVTAKRNGSFIFIVDHRYKIMADSASVYVVDGACGFDQQTAASTPPRL